MRGARIFFLSGVGVSLGGVGSNLTNAFLPPHENRKFRDQNILSCRVKKIVSFPKVKTLIGGVGAGVGVGWVG